ncbi:MAG: class I SAM-dependent methyltransferase [Pseudomonadota bacterium]
MTPFLGSCLMPDYDNLHKLWTKAHATGSPTKFVRDAVVYRELAKLHPGDTLDAGAGTGEYSLFLSQRGHKVVAFDPSPYAARMLADKARDLGIDVETYTSTIEDFSSSRRFDSIIAIEVIEHIEFDRAAVEKLFSLLKDGGQMVLSTPATPFLYSEADRTSGHFRRYRLSVLRELLVHSGFREVQVRRYGFPVLFVYSLARKLFLDRILIRHFASETTGSGGKAIAISRLYPHILIADQLNLPFWGVGYVATCRK